MSDAPNSRAILDQLVSFPTISSDSNLDLIDWAEVFFKSHGARVMRDYSPDRKKASLVAQIGPEAEGGVILSGHSDVVPVEGQNWTHPPFSVTQSGGRLYGRGTCDMKGFVALAMAAAARADLLPLKRPLQICISRDEEIGCFGAPPMIRAMQDHFPRAALAVIGEPTMMKPVNGHKGGIGFDTHLRGYEVHSSLIDRGVSAIMEGAKLINWANQINAENRAAAEAGKQGDSRYDPPYTTLHVGTIEGGTAHNITAKDCRFLMSIRNVPGESTKGWIERYIAEVRAIEAEMQKVHPDCAITLKQRYDVPGLKSEANGKAEELVRVLTGQNRSGVVSYGTEAGHFQQGGYSSIVCGPGDIAQAHQPDEYLSIAQFEAGEQFMNRLLATLQT